MPGTQTPSDLPQEDASKPHLPAWASALLFVAMLAVSFVFVKSLTDPLSKVVGEILFKSGPATSSDGPSPGTPGPKPTAR